MKMSTSVKLLCLSMVCLLIGCVVETPGFSASRSLDSYTYTFTPSDTTEYPPTGTNPIEVFKIIKTFPGLSDKVLKDEKPTRPYVVIGEVHFEKDWYGEEEEIQQLFDKYVPQIGGDAILQYVMHIEKSVPLKKRFEDDLRIWYRAELEIDVIRYTDK
jgi:hypothetical protein